MDLPIVRRHILDWRVWFQYFPLLSNYLLTIARSIFKVGTRCLLGNVGFVRDVVRLFRLLFTVYWKLIFPSCTSGVLITFSCGSTLIGLLKSKLCLLSSCTELLHGILFSVYSNHLFAHKRHLKSCVSITLYLMFYLFCIRLPTL